MRQYRLASYVAHPISTKTGDINADFCRGFTFHTRGLIAGIEAYFCIASGCVNLATWQEKRDTPQRDEDSMDSDSGSVLPSTKHTI